MAIGIGIAIDPDAIRGVVLERSGSRVKLVAVHEGLCDTANPDALTSALAQLRKALRVTAPVVLGLPSISTILTTLSALIVNRRRAALAVEFELQQHLPFPLTDAIWHHQWLSLVNGDGLGARSGLSSAGPRSFRTSNAVVAAVRQSLLQERLASCRRAGVSVRAVTINAIAALTVWEHARSGAPFAGQGAAGKGSARSVDAGARGGRAGESNTTLLRLNGARAAEWIRRAPEMLEVIPITGTSQETWWQELAASWEGISGTQASPSDPVCVIGPPAALSGLQQAGMAATRLELGRLVEGPAALMEQLDAGAAALGLALHGLGAVQLPLNLLAVSQGEERSQRTHRAAAMVAGLCMLAALGFGATGMMQMRRQRLQVLQALERQERLYLTLRPEVRSVIQRQEHTERRNTQLEQLITNGTMLSRLLAQITDAMPKSIWLTLLDCAKGPAGPAAQPGSADLMTGTLEGRSSSFQDVTQFMDRLKSVAEMHTVKPLSTNVITDELSGKEAIGFAVQIQRSLEAPVPAAAAPVEKERALSKERVSSEKPARSTKKTTPPTTASGSSSTKKPKRAGAVKR